MTHTIADARVVYNNGYPELHVEIDGVPTVLGDELHAPMAARGLTFLGSDFEGKVPTITFTDPAVRGPIELEGFTDDPRVFELQRRFLAYCNDETPFDPNV